MRKPEVLALITEAVLQERGRCARIADKYANDPHGSNPGCATAEAIADDIRSAKPPKIKRIIRPETAYAKPELVKNGDCVVAGIGLAPDGEIIGCGSGARRLD